MNDQIAEKILAELGGLKIQFGGLSTQVGDLSTEVGGLKIYTEKVAAEVVDVKLYMKEKMVTKDELKESENRVTTHLDGFVKLHENLDTELAALRGKYERLEERIAILERQVTVR